ncbi:MAG: cytochrome c-type biogenesis protein CcmH [Chloroflexota bacterium]|nr:cytochrome c-type biogenesis protein CcmH [Chloroflexota bacterium]
MRRLALPLAVAALLALGGLVVLELVRPALPRTAAEQAHQIAADLRCPDCQALSVAESETAAAAAIRQQILDLLAAGQTPDQVRGHFVERYGEWILLSPSSPIAWWLPPAALLLGIVLLAWWLRRRPPKPVPAAPASPAPSSEGARARVRDEVERIDA